MKHRNSNPKPQAGMTLIELMIVLSIGALILSGLALWGVGLYNKSKGAEEGRRLYAVTSCGVDMARSVTSLGSVTLPALVNNGCFGALPGVTGKGTSSASANSPLTGLPYTATVLNLMGTGDGFGVTTTTHSKYCPGIVEAAVAAGAIRVAVTPSGASPSVVKSQNAELDVQQIGLASACGGTDPIAVQVAIGR